MTNTNLLEVIKALNAKERQEMASFLGSPLFNRSKNAREIEALYQIVLSAAPDFSEEILTKEGVYSQLFSENTIIPGRLEKVVADLNKLLRNYSLIHQYTADSNEDQQQVDWARWLRIHGLIEDSRKVLTKLKAKKGEEEIQSLERFRTDLWIAEEEHEWEIKFNQVKGDLNIPTLIYHFERYYHGYRTELANRYLLQQKAAQLPEWHLPEGTTAQYQAESVLIRITQSINDLLRKEFPTVEEFNHLMVDLLENEKVLSYYTNDHFYTYLRNFCTLLINAGNLEFIPILHQIHKDNLPRGYLFVNGQISPNVYLNIVQIATRAKEVGWAKEFTETYKGHLVGGDEEQFFYRLNLAYCYFAEGNFARASEEIPEAPSSSYYHHLVRRLEIKIYYELQSDLLLYKLDAFRKFIERTALKTIAANIRTMNLNFLNILMQLSQIPRKDKTRAERLITRIEGKTLLADRAWLLEKARELG